MYGPNLKFVALPTPDIEIKVLGGVCEPPILGKRRPYRGTGCYRSKKR